MNETHVDLFSGLGCWAIAARVNGLRTVAMCEIEPWLREGLHRMWKCPVHHDVKTFDAEAYRGTWLLTGSPPCQPASVAGKRRGKADDRWLWDETIAVCEVIQPTWFIFENPPGIDGVGLDGIISDLERLGYEVAALRIPACAVNSPQDRDRFWVVGHSLAISGCGGQPGSRNALQHSEKNGVGKADRSFHAVKGCSMGNSKECDGRLPIQCGRSDETSSESGRTVKNSVVADCGKPAHSGSVQRERAPGDEAEPCVKDGTSPNPAASQSDSSGERLSGEGWASIGPCGKPWSDYEWISFNGAVYRIPVGLYSMADGVVHGIPKKFRSKLISALGNAIVWQVAAQLIKAIKANDSHHSRSTSR